MSNAIRKILNEPNLLEQVTKRCFDSVDTDKSGRIETKELRQNHQLMKKLRGF